MHLCTCVNERGGNEEGAGPEALSLLSYTCVGWGDGQKNRRFEVSFFFHNSYFHLKSSIMRVGTQYSPIEDGRLGVRDMMVNLWVDKCLSLGMSFRPLADRLVALTLTLQSGLVLIVFLLQAVAPGSAYGRAGLSHGRTMGRAATLVFVCGLAACVALLGGIGDAEEPVSQAFLAVKAEIQSRASLLPI